MVADTRQESRLDGQDDSSSGPMAHAGVSELLYADDTRSQQELGAESEVKLLRPSFGVFHNSLEQSSRWKASSEPPHETFAGTQVPSAPHAADRTHPADTSTHSATLHESQSDISHEKFWAHELHNRYHRYHESQQLAKSPRRSPLRDCCKNSRSSRLEGCPCPDDVPRRAQGINRLSNHASHDHDHARSESLQRKFNEYWSDQRHQGPAWHWINRKDYENDVEHFGNRELNIPPPDK